GHLRQPSRAGLRCDRAPAGARRAGRADWPGGRGEQSGRSRILRALAIAALLRASSQPRCALSGLRQETAGRRAARRRGWSKAIAGLLALLQRVGLSAAALPELR